MLSKSIIYILLLFVGHFYDERSPSPLKTDASYLPISLQDG